MRKLLHMSVKVAEKHLIVNQNRWVHRKKTAKLEITFGLSLCIFLGYVCACVNRKCTLKQWIY